MALRKRKTARVSRRPKADKAERRTRREKSEEEAPVSGGSTFVVDKVTLNTGAQRPVLIVEMTPTKKLVVRMSGGKLDTKSSKLIKSMLAAIPGGDEEAAAEDEEDLEEEDAEDEEDEDEEGDEEDEEVEAEDEEDEDEDEAPKKRSSKKVAAKKPARGKKKVKLDLDELTEELEDEEDE